MKSNQKLSLLFWLFKAKATKKDGKAPLYVRMTIDGEEDLISLSRKVDPQFWDTENKKVTDNSVEGKKTNKKMAEVRVDLERHFAVLQSQYSNITPLMLKNVYNGLPALAKRNEVKEPEEKIPTLLEALQTFIDRFEKMVEKKHRSKYTLTHWKTTRKKVEAFLIFQYKAVDIDLQDIKYAFAEKFYDYMTLEVDKPLVEVTAKKHIKKVRQILGACVRYEFLAKNPFVDFNCSGGERDVEPLEMEQVQAIYRKEFTIPRLIEVRDAFIFQCFTGFAYQDVYALTADNIINVGNTGERWLIKERGKTSVSEMVPILPIVEEIIDKYKNHPRCLKDNCLLPINSNTRYNGYLKEISDICGITIEQLNNKELGTHKARHTFADIMLNNGVPIEDVSRMLGHKSIRTTQRYCRVRKNRISESVNKVKTILFTSEGELRQVS
ncbi:site-specific integrase [Mucilaginibacter lappiensis]|uniref:Site-specific recombinase XerD n=1 Tax=Mucilaginibacter lappiensis TaxID=354630 RepID=A0A841JPA1_9SPHI|nr:site-specific integrase [Mucilaginibacter lappiensis]MBB6130578.1 site-specific recombinase XerD [Mucilaginibacter lappiensis]